jgi:dGTPase
MPTDATDWAEFEDRWLAPYAMRAGASRGRRHTEPPHPFRAPYQRDRERIVHSSAFRRMTGKTQVLVASVNDHHRTRLTHTLEVAQVARTVARRLRLNEDLTEAIALAHDIGHPPFGHAGESALDECLRDHGGFNHNLYGLRRVDELEERYPEFPGLNLTFEVREAFVQHVGPAREPRTDEFRDIGGPLLEAQVVDLVDSIAYDTHDVDDALDIGFVSEADLHGVEFWERTVDRVRAEHPTLAGKPLRTAVVRELLAAQVNDLLDETRNRLNREAVRSVQDVRRASTPLVGLSLEMELLKRGLERFLRDRVYRHHRVLRMTANGKRILRMLYEELVRSPELLPERQFRRWSGKDERCPAAPIERVVADYLAGMTDRYAQREYQRLFHPTIDL